MATWNYEARTADGRVVRGTRDAADRRSALEALRSEGFFVSRIEARVAKTNATPLRPKPNPPVANAAAVAPVAARQAQVRAQQAKAKFVVASELAREPMNPISSGEAGGVALGAATPLDSPVATTKKAARPAVKFEPDLTPPPGAGAPIPPDVAAGVLRPMGQSTSAPLASQPFLRASQQDMSNFFRQLAALMHAGTGLGVALQTMAENAANKSLARASTQMATRAMTGEPLSESMKAFPGLFSPLMIGITSAGESGGFLEAAFTRLADYAERDHDLQQSVKRETWYPKLIVFCAILIPGVVPLVLNGFNAFLAQVGPPLLIIGLLVLAWKVWLFVRPALNSSVDNFRLGGVSPSKIFDEIKLVIPVVGKTARALSSAKFCRALGALYSAGVGPSEAVRLGAQACGNRAVAERALATIPQLNAGEPLTQCMKQTRVFNPLALQMMRVGEESGDLDSQLDKAADFLETNAETTIKQAIPALGIVVFLCVAAYVGSIVVQMWTGYTTELGDFMKD